MEVGVAGAVVGATIRAALHNLLSYPAEEISLLWNFNKDIERLKRSLFTIRDFLEDAEAKQVNDNPIKRWLTRLEAVAFDADNVFDELNYQLLRIKVETDNKLKKKVRNLFSASNPLAFRRRISKRIKDINEELESINKEANYLGLQMRFASSYAHQAGTEIVETDAYATDRILIGRDDDLREIVEKVASSLTDRGISILPIVGMGGLGKTTLARTVYNHSKIISHFGNRIWVHVPQNFVPASVFKSILASLTGENVDGSRGVVLQKLQKSLGEERYLLVLDNVWSEEPEQWDNFITSLEGISPVKGNVIIVTTRSGNVASIVKTCDVHELGVLSEEDSWFIIKARAFQENDVDIPSEFGSLGKSIAKRCQGLPLAAKVVGSLLRSKTKDEWLSIQEKWFWDFGIVGNTVTKVLKLSYDNLSSSSLKKCFAYCSIFPKGSRMRREELVELWMAEGLLQNDQENDMESMGNKGFNILVQSSLLQIVGRDSYGNVEYCSMHDLVHDLAFSISNPKLSDDSHQVRYISPKSFAEESSPVTKKQFKYVRTLFFNGNISDIRFSKFKSLHVLILYDKDIKELPISIGELINLRYLDISHTSIESLPHSFLELYHFQTLRAVRKPGGRSYLRRLPETLRYLISLRHLRIPNIELPPGIGSLTSLQTLPYFRVGDEKGHRIEELGKLKNLKGELEISNLEKVQSEEEAKSADLCHKENISKLKLVWSKSEECGNNDENVLEGLQPHPNLKSLEINGFNCTNFPLWTLQMAVKEDFGGHWVRLDNLIQIRISGCEECEEIPMMGHLPQLKSLYLHNLTNLKTMVSSFYGIQPNKDSKEKVIVFPALDRLELTNLTNLTKWGEVERPSSSAFPLLEYLKVINCRQLMSAPSQFSSLKELEIYNMESGLPLLDICGSNLTSLTKLRIEKVDGLRCLPDGLFYNNPDLLELDITNCQNLRQLVPKLGGVGACLRKLVIWSCWNFTELPDDLYSLETLEVLKIWRCPSLMSIPYPRGAQLSTPGFTSLRELEICYCSQLITLPPEMIESCVPSLEGLWLTGSKRVTNLHQVINILQKMPGLTKLRIEKVPRFSDIAAEIGSLRTLHDLGIGGSSDTTDYASFEASLDCFFQLLQSLSVLGLRGTRHWDTLPHQLQHLTYLRWLYLSDFGIEALPEWLENLTSLKSLDLFSCRELKCFPSKNAMLRLTKLNDISIRGCPLLEQSLEQQQSDESEWAKISHIPYIKINGRRFSAHAQ